MNFIPSCADNYTHCNDHLHLMKQILIFESVLVPTAMSQYQERVAGVSQMDERSLRRL